MHKRQWMNFFLSRFTCRPQLPWSPSGKESACQCRRCGFDPWVGKIPWRRNWQPTLVFFPGKSHGQKSPVGYSPWGCKGFGQDLSTKQQQQTSFKRNTQHAFWNSLELYFLFQIHFPLLSIFPRPLGISKRRVEI